MNKEYFKSKTFWASVLIALGIVGSYLNGAIDITACITGVGAALGLFGLRSGLGK